MKSGYKIPEDIYDGVYELLLDIVNASPVGDDILCAVYFEKLREFCEQQTAAGRASGFM